MVGVDTNVLVRYLAQDDPKQSQVAIRLSEGLLATKQLVIERPELVWKALRSWEGVLADFSDALIGQLAIAHGADMTVTLDRTAAKLPGFDLLALGVESRR